MLHSIFHFLSRNFFKFYLAIILLFFIGIQGTSASSSIIAEQCKNGSCIPLLQEAQVQTVIDNYAIGDIITLQITAKNPSQASIYSTQTWIQYNPAIFEVIGVKDTNTDFPLSAPGEMNADPLEGIIKIGRAVAGLPVQKQSAIIASIELKILQNPENSVLEFYDFRASDVGKTSLLTLQNMLPENILQNKPKAIVFSSLKSAGQTNSGNTNNNGNNQQGNNGTTSNPGNNTSNPYDPYGQNTNNNNIGTQNPYIPGNNIGSPSASNSQTNSSYDNGIDIPRPQGFRSRTYANGTTEHIWQIGEDPRIKGYYLYYSYTSGRYMHRRDVGNTNVYQFPAGFFEQGKRIYFAIQAYDTQAKTSDFSDETYLVVGHAGSESHPFFEQIFPDVDPNNAVIVRDANGNIIYQGTRKDNYDDNISKSPQYPDPNKNTQTGSPINISFIILSLFLSCFAWYYSKKKPVLYSENRAIYLNRPFVQWA